MIAMTREDMVMGSPRVDKSATVAEAG
jgi:hypothetical protein